LKLLKEENRVFLGTPVWDDGGLLYVCSKHSNNPGRRYRGGIRFNTSTYVIEKCVGAIIANLEDFVYALSGICNKINATISLCDRHSRYGCSHFDSFSRNDSGSVVFDGVEYDPVDWLPYHYLLGAEWGNLISKHTMELLPGMVEKAKLNDKMIVKEFGKGSCFIKLRKPIMDITLSDMFMLKDLLYPALIPGYRWIPSNPPVWRIRERWELMPLLDNEIEVVGNNDILLVHKRSECTK